MNMICVSLPVIVLHYVPEFPSIALVMYDVDKWSTDQLAMDLGLVFGASVACFHVVLVGCLVIQFCIIL